MQVGLHLAQVGLCWFLHGHSSLVVHIQIESTIQFILAGIILETRHHRIGMCNPNHAAMWFVKRIWHDAPYRDALKILASRFNILDRAMMYEALTGNKWGDPVYIFINALHFGSPAELVKHCQKEITLIKHMPRLRIPDVSVVIPLFWSTTYLLDWVKSSIQVGDMRPLEYIINKRTKYQITHLELYRIAIECDNVIAVELLLGSIPMPTGLRMRPNTWHLFPAHNIHCNPRDILECIAAHPAWVDIILERAGVTMRDMLPEIITYDDHLSFITQYFQPADVLACINGRISTPVLIWLASKVPYETIPMQFWNSAFVEKMWLRITSEQRSTLLVRNVYAMLMFRNGTLGHAPICKMTFLRYATCWEIKKIEHLM
jgi:hypothetical protein